MNRSIGSDDFGRRDGRDRRSGNGGGGGRDRSPLGGTRQGRNNCRVFVSNLPYEYRWQDLKDLFRREVGNVSFVELFTDEFEKSRGCGIIEFDHTDCVKKALDRLHRYDVEGRKIVVKEDFGAPRDKFGNILRSRDRGDDIIAPARGDRGVPKDYDLGETYGLSHTFLEGLGVFSPLVNRVFVANLDYKVTEKKLKEVFRLAGKVRNVELSMDSDGKSRGFAVVEYDHPVECVQAISMLHNQQLYDRRMTVRMDRVDAQESNKLPEGLQSVGMGLGQNGAPLKDVARNLPSSSPAPATPLSGPSNLNNLASALGNPFSAISGLGSSAAALQAAAVLAPSNNNLDPIARDLALSNLAGLSSSLIGNNSSTFSLDKMRDSFNDRDNDRNAPKNSDTIVVGNLPHKYTWQNLKDKFRDCGDIKFAEMRGNIGLVRFGTEWEALRAMSLLNGSRVEGNKIEVRLF